MQMRPYTVDMNWTQQILTLKAELVYCNYFLTSLEVLHNPSQVIHTNRTQRIGPYTSPPPYHCSKP